MPKGRCAPLGEVAHSREGSLPLERWHPSTLPFAAHLAWFGHVGEVAAHTSPLGSPLLTLGVPSFYTWCALLPLAFASCAIYTSILSHCELVGVCGLLLVVVLL